MAKSTRSRLIRKGNRRVRQGVVALACLLLLTDVQAGAGEDVARQSRSGQASPEVQSPGREADRTFPTDLGPEVFSGCPGWLFLSEERRTWPDGLAALDRRLDTVARLNRELTATGVHLLAVPVPAKLRIESRNLCTEPPGEVAGRYLRILEGLRSRGIDTVDLYAALAGKGDGRPLYYRLDTHWNRAGAELAARAVAAAATPWLGDTPATRWTFMVDEAGRQPAPADLLRVAGLDAVPADWGQAGEEVAGLEVRAERPGGLLDDIAPPVVVLGSSYSMNSEFAERIGRALGVDVANLARSGGGFLGAVRAWQESEAARSTPPRVLIWEFPERVMEQPGD